MDFPCPHLPQLAEDLLEALSGQGRLAGLAPVIAHLTLEIAAIEDLYLDIQRHEGTGMQDCLAKAILPGFDFLWVVHEIPMLSLGDCGRIQQ